MGRGATGSRGSVDPHFVKYAVHMRRLTPTFCQLFRLRLPTFRYPPRPLVGCLLNTAFNAGLCCLRSPEFYYCNPCANVNSKSTTRFRFRIVGLYKSVSCTQVIASCGALPSVLRSTMQWESLGHGSTLSASSSSAPSSS